VRSIVTAGALGLAVIILPRLAGAEAGSCAGPLTRANVAACALRASPALQEQLAAQRATAGRRETARSFLPANPTLAGTVASRKSDSARDTNWSLTLGQQIEIGGQRGLRLGVADREARAQEHRVTAARARIAAAAWTDYFAVLAMRERLALSTRLESATQGVATTVRGMAASGVASEVDADIADAAALRVTVQRLRLEGEVAAARAQLAILTGVESAEIEGDLEPLRGVAAPEEAAVRPELLALREDELALAARVDLLKRERVPSPTISLLAQDDGFNERVLGVGLSVPIPLPQPLGRTNAGEIAATAALSEQARAGADTAERELHAELTTAMADLRSATQARALYASDRLARVAARLESVAAQVKAGRLAVRDGLIAQQALVEQLESAISAREWLCVASVRLARAAGLALEGDAL
jgi:cobalt-zinc-cadmium efflux system outer membrane protein